MHGTVLLCGTVNVSSNNVRDLLLQLYILVLHALSGDSPWVVSDIDKKFIVTKIQIVLKTKICCSIVWSEG